MVVIAMHRGSGRNLEIAQVAVDKKWPFPVYNGGVIKGNDRNTNPQSFIFDAKGDLVFDSRFESDTEKALAKFGAAAPDWLLGDKAIAKLTVQHKSILSRKDLGKTMVELAEKLKSEDAAEKEEAEFLSKRLEWYAGQLKARASQMLADGRPTETLAVLKEIAAQFKGHDIGKTAEDESAEKKNDAAFKKELAAESIGKNVEKAYLSVKPRKSDEDEEKWRKKNAKPLGQIKTCLDSLKKSYSDTRVFQVAAEMAAEFGVE